MWVGGSYNVSGKTAVTAAYNKASNSGDYLNDNKTNVLMAMVTYSLSKKSTVYAEFDSQKNDAGTGAVGAERKIQGLALGLDVKF
jgi:predicted porin